MGITLVNFYLSWLNWSHFLVIEGGLLIILMDFLIFLLPFLVLQGCLCQQFLSRTARLWNSMPIECFHLTYDLCGFKSRVKRHLLTVGSFETDLLYALAFLCFFFLYITPYLIMAVQPFMEWIAIKKDSVQLFYYFNFERIYMWRLKSKSPCIFFSKYISFDKNQTESKTKNPMHSFWEKILVLQLI